ncbi:MAG: CDP-alcohol phosphatidyltransferase family protein, partial [Anaerolineales bacterium]|nr:CDP-alcohol phosphatidyltransferase family protein [Anaerolineales bacterium]
MFDALFRRYKDRVLAPITGIVSRLSPNQVTVLAFVFGLGAAGFAAAGWTLAALAAWLTNRVLDGLDGTLARKRSAASDLGGYLDIVLDFGVYAAVPLGVAWGLGPGGAHWIALSVLLAS